MKFVDQLWSRESYHKKSHIDFLFCFSCLRPSSNFSWSFPLKSTFFIPPNYMHSCTRQLRSVSGPGRPCNELIHKTPMSPSKVQNSRDTSRGGLRWGLPSGRKKTKRLKDPMIKGCMMMNKMNKRMFNWKSDTPKDYWVFTQWNVELIRFLVMWVTCLHVSSRSWLEMWQNLWTLWMPQASDLSKLEIRIPSLTKTQDAQNWKDMSFWKETPSLSQSSWIFLDMTLKSPSPPPALFLPLFESAK